MPTKLKRRTATEITRAQFDKRLAKGLDDIRKGRVHGPFATGEEAVKFLHKRLRKIRAARRKRSAK